MSNGNNKIEVLLEVDDRGTASLQRFGRTVAQTGKDGERAFTGMSAASSNLARGVASLAASYVSLQGVRALISIADQYTQLEGRLRLVTTSTAELAAVETQLYAVAQQTRVGYAETVELYTRLARATKDTGISQTELMSTVQAVNQALIVSGATTTEANAALIQFSQGMASGVLRGEELNSVMEQTPRIAQMIADGLGISTGQLREWGKEGKLTSDVVMPALLKSAGEVNREFGLMPTTVAQAGTVLANTLKGLVADANSGSGATAELAAAIVGVSTAVDANRENILGIFAAIVTAAGQAGQAILNIANSVKGFAAVAAGELSLKEFAGMGSGELTQWMKDYDSGLATIRDQVKETAATLKELREQDPDLVDEDALGRAERAFNAAQKEMAAFEAKGKEVAAASKQVATAQDTAAKATTTTTRAVSTAGAAKKALAKESVTAGKAAKDLAAEQKRLAEEAERTGRAQIEAATKTREMTAELDKALFDTGEAYETLGLTSKAVYEQQVRDLEAAKDRILTLENLSVEDQERVLKAFNDSRKELEDDYLGKVEETTGAIGIAWEDLTEDTKQVLHDWVEQGIKMEFDSVGDAFESLAEAILNVWIDLLAKMIAEWAISGIASLFSGGNLLGGITSGLGGLLGGVPIIGDLFGKSGGTLAEWGLTGAGTSALMGGGAVAAGSSLLGGGAGSAAFDWGLNSFGVPALGGGAAAAGAAATSFGAGAAEAFGSALIGGPTAGGLEWAAIPGKEFFGTGASQTAAAGGAGMTAGMAATGFGAFVAGLYALSTTDRTPWQSITSPTLGIGVDMPVRGGYGESDARRRASTLLDIGSGLYDPSAGGGGDAPSSAFGALAEFDLKPIIEDARGLLDILANQWGDGLAKLALDMDGSVAATDRMIDAAAGYDVSLSTSAELNSLAAEAVGGSSTAMESLRATLQSLGLSEEQTETAMLGLIAATGSTTGKVQTLAAVLQSQGMSAADAQSTARTLVSAMQSQATAAGGAATAIGGMTGKISALSSTPLNIRVGVETYRIDNSNPYAEHASGGIFSSPTLIPSIRGTRHLVGEAGAEAIMPLHAGPKTLELMDRKLDALAARPMVVNINGDAAGIARFVRVEVDRMMTSKSERRVAAKRVTF